MKPKYGPARSELFFRLWCSVIGIGLMGLLVVLRGWPSGPAAFETIGIAGAFFGGTFIWTLRRIVRKEYSDGL